MAAIKVACAKCGQKVSGDENFYGTVVQCPICSSDIRFPSSPADTKPAPPASAPPTEPGPESEPEINLPIASAPEVEKPAWNPPPRSSYVEPSATSSLAVASLVIGLCNVFVACLPSLLFAPAGIICGHMALGRIKRQFVPPLGGRGMATTGLVLGYLGLIALFGYLIFFGSIQALMTEYLSRQQ